MTLNHLGLWYLSWKSLLMYREVSCSIAWCVNIMCKWQYSYFTCWQLCTIILEHKQWCVLWSRVLVCYYHLCKSQLCSLHVSCTRMLQVGFFFLFFYWDVFAKCVSLYEWFVCLAGNKWRDCGKDKRVFYLRNYTIPVQLPVW